MKKRFIVMAVVAALLVSCLNLVDNEKEPEKSNTETPNTETPGIKTAVVFDNARGEYPVVVYSDRGRENKIAEIPQGATSQEVEWTSGTPTFYFTYRISLKDVSGFTLNYIPTIGKDQAAVRLDEGKTTTVPVPRLEDTVSSPEEPLTGSSYLQIRNNSAFPFKLLRGDAAINPDNSSDSTVNSQEQPTYTASPGPASGYRILTGVDYKPLPASIDNFEAGHLYRFEFNGGTVSLNTDMAIKLANVLPSPEVPQNVQAVALSTIFSVLITWNTVPGASGYKVYRNEGNGSYTPIYTAGSATTSYTDTGLTPNGIYYYKVSALASGVESALSGPVSAALSLPAPGNLRVSSQGATSVSLSWDSVTGASGYKVYRAEENGSYTPVYSAGSATTSYTDTGLTPSSTCYYYKVSALTSSGEGRLSGPVSTFVGVIVPGTSLTEKLAWLQSNAESGGSYLVELAAGEYIGPQTLSYGGKSNVSITLRGTGAQRTIGLASNGSLFTVESGVTLNLDNNVTLGGLYNNTSSVIKVNLGGSVFMNEGSKITGNTVSASFSYGGGVYNNGTFTMDGGEIIGNTVSGLSSSNGGGVYNSGTFIMNGGEISANTASVSSSYGGGVYNGGTFIMNGGEISSNTSSSGFSFSNGGGVFNNGIFTMNGGEISANTASASYSYGGGVNNFDGTFRMVNGVVYGNTARYGAAIYKSDSLSGGTMQAGILSGSTFIPVSSLSTSNTTVRVVNGIVQP